jgi:hypothetical protein
MPLPGLIPWVIIRLWRWFLLRPEQRGRFFQRARILLVDPRAAYGLSVLWLCPAPLGEIIRIATIGGMSPKGAVRVPSVPPKSTVDILVALYNGTVGEFDLVHLWELWKGGI